MKLRIFLFSLVVFALATGARAQAGNVEQTLIQMEHDWAQALARNDQAALDHILAVGWIVTDADGQMMTKAQSDANRKSGVLKYDSFTVDDMKVRVFGNTAIVTGRSTVKGTSNGKEISGQERFTDVFVQRDGRWQAVATHISRVAKP